MISLNTNNTLKGCTNKPTEDIVVIVAIKADITHAIIKMKGMVICCCCVVVYVLLFNVQWVWIWSWMDFGVLKRRIFIFLHLWVCFFWPKNMFFDGSSISNNKYLRASTLKKMIELQKRSRNVCVSVMFHSSVCLSILWPRN